MAEPVPADLDALRATARELIRPDGLIYRNMQLTPAAVLDLCDELESARQKVAAAEAEREAARFTAAKWFARAVVADAALSELVRACEAMEGLAADAVDLDTRPDDMPTAPPLFDQFEVAMLAARAALAGARPEEGP